MTLYTPALSRFRDLPDQRASATTDLLASKQPLAAKPVSATPAGVAAVISRQEATLAQSSESNLYLLERAASENDLDEFVKIAGEMHWNSYPAEAYLRAIGLALKIGAPLTARTLAQHGAKRFPGHLEIAKYARVLAPVKTIQTGLPPEPALALNTHWLREQRGAYLGKWVALRNGILLAEGSSFQELRQQLGPLKNSGILVTKVY